MKSRLLVVEDDQAKESVADVLRAVPVEVRGVCDIAEALNALRSTPFHLLVLDHKFPEVASLDFVRGLRIAGQNLPFIILGDSVTVAFAVEAMKLGAIDVLGKPVNLGRLRDAVCRGLGSKSENNLLQTPASVLSHDPVTLNGQDPGSRRISPAERLAQHIVKMIDCDEDPKTISDWSRHVGASSSTIREYCRLVHVKPQNARDLGRVLRGICRSGSTWLPEIVLDCSDIRTLKKIMTLAGLGARRGGPTPSALELLHQQHWVPQDHALLSAIKNLLSLMFTSSCYLSRRAATNGNSVASDRC